MYNLCLQTLSYLCISRGEGDAINLLQQYTSYRKRKVIITFFQLKPKISRTQLLLGGMLGLQKNLALEYISNHMDFKIF